MVLEDYFQVVEKPRLSEEVARQLVLAIQEGRLLPGHTLPPIRELADRFHVSRPILREALYILQSQGYINVQQGRRTSINYHLNTSPAKTADWLKANQKTIRDLFTAREAVETVCARLAAANATAQDIEDLNRLLERESELLTGEPQNWGGLEYDFHTLLARIAGNSFLQQILVILLIPKIDLRPIMEQLPGQMQSFHECHQQVVEAVACHDAAQASQAITDAFQKPIQAIDQLLQSQEDD